MSINDDLETFLENILLGKEPMQPFEVEWLYFLPKLTEHEMELVEREDEDFLKTFCDQNPDVKESEMKDSESDAKFNFMTCERKSFMIKKPICSIQ